MTTEFNHCEFYGVRWEEKSIETIQTVAQAPLNLTELFKSQNIEIECLLKVDNPCKEGE